jgi:putative transposase
MSYRPFDYNRSMRRPRKSFRLPKHDYRWTGAYFVTLRTENHEPMFEVPELRTILEETWKALPSRFPEVTLDEFVIMPDHVHFIIWLNGIVEHAPALGAVVGAYKSLTTVAWLRHIEAAKLQYAGRFWQRNYYERCIREKGELEQTRQYIRNNPTKSETPEIEKRNKPSTPEDPSQ